MELKARLYGVFTVMFVDFDIVTSVNPLLKFLISEGEF